MAADTQASGKEHWEYAIKVKQIDKHSLMACEGSGDYIELFADSVRSALSTRDSADYKVALNSAIRSYAKQMKNDIEQIEIPKTELSANSLVRIAYPRAAFATYRSPEDSQLFEIKPPYPCFELELPHRVTVGSGDLLAAGFLKNAEFFMSKVGLSWIQVSTSLVSQLCWLLLGRIEHVDRGTSGALVYRINAEGTRQLSMGDVWGKQERESWSVIFLRTALGEIPEQGKRLIMERYKPDILKGLP